MFLPVRKEPNLILELSRIMHALSYSLSSGSALLFNMTRYGMLDMILQDT